MEQQSGLENRETAVSGTRTGRSRATDGADPWPSWRRQHDATGRPLDRQIAPPRSTSRRHARLREPEPGPGLVSVNPPTTRSDFNAASMSLLVREMTKTLRSHPQEVCVRDRNAPRASPSPRTPPQRVARPACGKLDGMTSKRRLTKKGALNFLSFTIRATPRFRGLHLVSPLFIGCTE